jgi:membrane carboxypeptidase/penicillin-binding protein
LLDQPEIQIEQAEPLNLENFNDIESLFSGKSNLLVTPLQVALAYAPFANGGNSVEPSLTTAYKIPGGEWILLDKNITSEQSAITISPFVSSSSLSNGSGWFASATVPIDTGHLDWYVMGTPHNWQGVPIILVVALENSTPIKAREIGNAVFLFTTNQ